MIYNVLAAACATYIIVFSLVADAHGDLIPVFVFKILPLLLGIVMGFFVVAKFMGWPI